jgi:tetratricopeptide (TPR) repeat protein
VTIVACSTLVDAEVVTMTSQSKFDVNSLRQYITCDACGKENPSKRCSRCRCTFYCSVECQQEHWTKSNHKGECRPYLELKKQMSGVHTLSTEESEHVEPVNTCCSICLDEPIVNQIVLKDCHHAFCLTCLMEWQKYKKNEACPMCRQAIEKTVAEEAFDKAMQYAAAGRLVEHVYEPILTLDDETSLPKEFPSIVDERQKRFYDLTMDQITQVLLHNPNDLQALVIKGQIFRFIHPEVSIEAFQRALEIDQRGSSNLEKLKTIENQMRNPDDPTEEEEVRYLAAYDEIMASSDSTLTHIGSGPFRLYEIKIWLAEAYEAAGRYKDAAAIYQALLNEVFSFGHSMYMQISPPTNRMMISGDSRCCYFLKNYERAKRGAEMALEMNRHFPSIHMLVAQAQWALGEKDTAVITMKRGILYEAPWDEKNQERNIAFLERMLSALRAEE